MANEERAKGQGDSSRESGSWHQKSSDDSGTHGDSCRGSQSDQSESRGAVEAAGSNKDRPTGPPPDVRG